MTMEKVSFSLLSANLAQTFTWSVKYRVQELFMPDWQYMTGRMPVFVTSARHPAASMAMQV